MELTAQADNMKQVPLPKNTMVVARENGRLYVVDFTEFPHLDDPAVVDWSISVSKLLIGKIKLSRASMIALHEIECENVVKTGQFPEGTLKDFQMTVFGSSDGKNITTTIEPHIAENDGGFVHAKCRLVAKNIEIQLRGTFNVNTIMIAATPAGRR